MHSIKSILDQILTEAHEGPSLGCIDRCSREELDEAENEFPHLRRQLRSTLTEESDETKPD